MVPSKGREINHLAGYQPRGVISTTQQGGKSTNGGASVINGAGHQPNGGKTAKIAAGYQHSYNTHSLSLSL